MPADFPRRAALLALPALLSGCSWFTDFRAQPKIEPWESFTADSAKPVFRGNPQGSVPITGAAVTAWQVSYTPTPAAVDSMSGLANPVAPSDSSLALGHRYYQINCAVCHGDDGQGTKNMAVARYGLGINIVGATTQARTDGYIFGMIRNGRGLMPSYNRIEEQDRWHVVNYVRGLQGRLGRQVATGPVGYPGQTGTALPGATQSAPTLPVPHNVTIRTTGSLDLRGSAGDAAAPAAAPAGAAAGGTVPNAPTAQRPAAPNGGSQ